MLTYISQTVSSNLQVSSVQVTLAVCVGLFVLYRKSESWNRKLPPGPMALPVIGNLLRKSFNFMVMYIQARWTKSLYIRDIYMDAL